MKQLIRQDKTVSTRGDEIERDESVIAGHMKCKVNVPYSLVSMAQAFLIGRTAVSPCMLIPFGEGAGHNDRTNMLIMPDPVETIEDLILQFFGANLKKLCLEPRISPALAVIERAFTADCYLVSLIE